MQLLARVESIARSHGDRPAYRVASGATLTYRELASRVCAARGLLLKRARPGDAIILYAANDLAWPVAMLGAISAGLDVLALPASTKTIEVGRLAQKIGAAAVIASASCGTSAPLVVDIAELMSEALMPQSGVTSAGSLLLTSSGSTGEPKIVRRSAASLDAVAANMVEAIEFSAGDRVLAAIPLAHSYGIEHGLLAPLWAGATVHLFDGLDVEAIGAPNAACTIFPAVPSLIECLADAARDVRNLSKLRMIYSAGAPLPDAVRERFVARYGRPIGQLYGSTEIGTVTYRCGDARPGADVGWPMRDVSIRILESGEVAIRSPSMFSGYVGEGAELVDGHYITGDLGHLTADGALALTGRSKLLIDIGGLKVNPLEVEAALETHTAVAQCVVMPLRQSETVSRVKAIIVPRDPAALPSVESLRAHARSTLAPHKVPRSFEFRETLPRSATGKVLRTMLDDS